MQRPCLDRDIKALSDFRSSIRECIAEVRNSGRPIVITQHGRPCAVLLDVTVFESLLGAIEGRGHDIADSSLSSRPVARKPTSDDRPLPMEQIPIPIPIPIPKPQFDTHPAISVLDGNNISSPAVKIDASPVPTPEKESEIIASVASKIPASLPEPTISEIAPVKPLTPDKTEPSSTLEEQQVWQQAEPKRRTVKIRRIFKPSATDAQRRDETSGNDLIPCDYSKILIADDEKTIRDVFKMVLSYGLPDCRVDLAVNGAEALSRFGTSHHGIVLMDLKMPSMTGETAFDEIQKLCAQIKWEMPSIVFCTGYDPPHRIRDLVDGDQRHGFLRKPVTADQLLGMLKTKLPP